MARINLLPWREELRKERKKNFLIALGATVGAAVVVLFIANYVLNGQIEQQRARNAFIQTELSSLDREITEVNGLKKKKTELLSRMEVIQSLQGNRPVIVRVFDEFVRVVPEGVYFVTLDMKDNQLNITGVSESNNRISKLMRNLDDSEWFSNPNLTAVKALDNKKGSSFDLVVRQVAPAQEKDKGDSE